MMLEHPNTAPSTTGLQQGINLEDAAVYKESSRTPTLKVRRLCHFLLCSFFLSSTGSHSSLLLPVKDTKQAAVLRLAVLMQHKPNLWVYQQERLAQDAEQETLLKEVFAHQITKITQGSFILGPKREARVVTIATPI